MTHKQVLEFPLKIFKNKHAQKVVIYSVALIFIILTASQNLNLALPYLFDYAPCEIEYTSFHKTYKISKAYTYDLLVISSLGLFLSKYKFCVLTLTGFYAVVLSRVVWSTMSIDYFELEEVTIDLTTTAILNFAWFTILIHKLKRK